MKILDVCCGSRMFWFDKKIKILFTWIFEVNNSRSMEKK